MDGGFLVFVEKKKKKEKKRTGRINTEWGGGGVRKLDTTSWQKLLELYNDRKKTKSLLITN